LHEHSLQLCGAATELRRDAAATRRRAKDVLALSRMTRQSYDLVAATSGFARKHDILLRLAAVLEQSALAADQHADREERAGRPDSCESERRLAQRAREGADRARALAAK
jgi:hypothetical protein